MIRIPQGAEEATGERMSKWVRDEGEYRVRVKEAKEGRTQGGDAKIDLALCLHESPETMVAYDTLAFSPRGANIALAKLRGLTGRDIGPGDEVVPAMLNGLSAWVHIHHEDWEGKPRNRVSMDYGKCGYAQTPEGGATTATPNFDIDKETAHWDAPL